MTDEGDAFTRHKARRDSIWSRRGAWDKIYQDVYDYALPHRRPGYVGSAKNPVDRIFDMTATMSAMQFAGSLQQDLFPSGISPFSLESGPIAKMRLGGQGASQLDRLLEKMADSMFPFFLTGDWDTAIHETCIDLGVGTGAILPVKGNPQDPVIFVSIPFDEIAIGADGYGRTNFVSWKQRMERYAIRDAFPRGSFPDGFFKNSNMTDEVPLFQDFVKDPNGYGWHFRVSLQHDPGFVATDRYRTQPIAVPRYYRVPGEAYGRGPVLLALPSIKTLNKAQELALKSAAIQMLGIWGFRAGGTFNPDTVRVGPGEFWPMQSTGGVLGPDVSRIDPASGRADVARMVIGDLRGDIKQALYDNRLPEEQGTPRSASEIVARLRQKAEVHIGAFGRLTHEIMPVVVPRVAEILFELGFLGAPINVDQLLIATSVKSPMAAALNAERLASIAQYVEIIQTMAGPAAVPIYANMEKILEQFQSGLNIRKDLVPTPEERQQIQAAQQQQQQEAMMSQVAMDAAPKMIEGAMAQGVPQ